MATTATQPTTACSRSTSQVINSVFLWGAERVPRPTERIHTVRMASQPFAGLLLGLLSGASAVSEFLGLVLNEAVETVLLRVARDHSLDYRALLDRYKADVVAEFSRVSDAPAAGRCSETVARSGRQCRRRGVLGGRCAAHAAPT